MIINLNDINIFDENSIDLDKKTCFIFGNNGTGKSTFSNYIKNNFNEYDVRLFQGFKSVVNNNDELNAVVLGEENVIVDGQLKEINAEIENINIKKLEKEILIDPSSSDKDNLYRKLSSSEEKFKNYINQIENFYSREASRIKNIDPAISKINYNKNDFKEDIRSANFLSEDDVKKQKNILKSEVKKAPAINFPEINTIEILEDVNNLLLKTVEETIKLPRLDDNEDKIEFAKKGLKIHKVGEKCSFCGNEISKECFEQLDKYFSGEDITKFENELTDKANYLVRIITDIDKLELNIEYFYESYFEEFRNIEKDFLDTKKELLEFFQILLDSISSKQKKLFTKVGELNINTPKNFNSVKESYNKLSKLNNSSDLELKKIEAKEKLRLHEVKNSLLEYNYDEKSEELKEYKKLYQNSKSDYDLIESEVNELKRKIDSLNEKKHELKSKSKNEEKLATEINKLLGVYVNFNLIYFKHEEIGYYKIQSRSTREIRDVKQLSMGEKNIIAFLYFLKKLEEVTDMDSNLKKIIIFDDPMSSNDNNMQYVMIEELTSLINRVQKEESVENLIVMTHNHHFYLNLTGYLRERNNKYKRYKFLRFYSNGTKTKIQEINNANEDFKSNYDALWQDLMFIYNSEGGRPGLLCNIARRIVDTFTNFNSISKNKFYESTKGAKKLFDVNSHEIEDFDADLEGVSKERIISILYDCFKNNNGSEHFEKHFPIEVLKLNK